MGRFDDDTRVEARPDTTFAGEVVDGWDIAGNANGGYLLAVAARAMATAVERPDPVTISAHYLAPGRPGPVVIDPQVVKVGKRFTTASATMTGSDGRPVLAALGTFGSLEADDGGATLVDAAPPDLPPTEQCRPRSGGTLPPGGFMQRVELRIHPDDVGFSFGAPTGTMRIRGWFRFVDDEPVDTTGLLLVVDAFPPTVFNSGLAIGWVPTVELTAHVRARPAPGWLRCAFTTRFVTGGFLEEDGEVWDATDRLVAQSRQLALVPRPPTPGN